jgi:lysophospholipase L1-like esterase
MSLQKKILCIGDSHTAGFPQFDPNFGGIPESSYEFWLEVFLQEEFPKYSIELDNEGICGEFSSDIYHRLLAIPNLKKYICILFWGGANDLGMGRSAKEIWKSINLTVQYCNSEGIPIFIFTIPPMNINSLQNDLLRLNELIRTNLSSQFIDVYPNLENNGRLDRQFGIGDGVHLSIKGYKTVAGLAFRSLKDFLPNILS